MSVASGMKSRVKHLLDQYHTQVDHSKLTDERDFIRRTSSFFKNQTISYGQASFTTQSANIDGSPIVRFQHPTPWPNPDSKELGDLLFIIKHKRGPKVVEKRAIIVQSKFARTSQRSWKRIDTTQFYLLLRWPSFTRVSPGPHITYSLNPDCLTWGTYAFLGPMAMRFPLYFTPSRILHRRPSILSQKTFTFGVGRISGWDTSPSFLMRLILCYIGENLNTNHGVQLLVNDLCKITGLLPDPPGEFEWEPIERDESKGFGVVEFTLALPEAIDERKLGK